MGAFVVVIVLSLLVAGLVIGVAAYPHRRHRIPGPEPVRSALDTVGSRVTAILDDASAER
jgi:hypothetical protein